VKDGWDNRYCGLPTKSGKRCRAHAQMDGGGRIIGCYLHDPRRTTYGEERAREEREAKQFRRRAH
jgi:hypothetical protein